MKNVRVDRKRRRCLFWLLILSAAIAGWTRSAAVAQRWGSVNVNADSGSCTASNVNLGTPTITDNCSASEVTITNNAPTVFPIGTTTVTWTIKDAAGNTVTCNQTVTVTDNQTPSVVSCAAPVNVNADNGS